MPTPSEMSAEIASLLVGLPRGRFGALKSKRLRQLEKIGLHTSMTNQDFAFVKAEIVQIRKAQIARLENWRRISGGH